MGDNLEIDESTKNPGEISGNEGIKTDSLN